MLHLLLIEDNPADVMMFREALRGSPIPADVTIAYDGEQALRLLEEIGSKSDFIVLDLSIPKVGGHSILERHKSLSRPPIVVFTSSLNDEDKSRALANGADDYVVKPAGFNAFIQAVQAMVERWAAPPGLTH
ncbi:MAG TPA: response regulator [Bryobacteraceae bacterium]|nr:response regulator [Bryobacteraceae bacterium]